MQQALKRSAERSADEADFSPSKKSKEDFNFTGEEEDEDAAKALSPEAAFYCRADIEFPSLGKLKSGGARAVLEVSESRFRKTYIDPVDAMDRFLTDDQVSECLYY